MKTVGSYWILLLAATLLSFSSAHAQDFESEPEIEELDGQSKISDEHAVSEAENAGDAEMTGDDADAVNAETVEPEQATEDAEPSEPEESTEQVKPEQPEPESDAEQNAGAEQDEQSEQDVDHTGTNNLMSKEHDVASDNHPSRKGKPKQPKQDSNEEKDKWVGLRVMSFNTWHFGADVENGFDKIVDSILLANPDVVALQEVRWHNISDSLLPRLRKVTGNKWFGVDNPQWEYPDVAIVSPHQLINESFTNTDVGIGIDIQLIPGLPKSVVHFWSVHLDWQVYGPYDLCDPQKASTYQYYPTRLEQMVRITNRIKKLVNPTKPKIIVGDFNEPSHLDWVEEAQSLHCQRVYEWGVSKHLEDEGYTDTFRVVHPDPLATPGSTWSTVRKWKNADKNDFSVPEPQDRIDWILTQGDRFMVEGAETYQGRPDSLLRVEPNYLQNDWPSDHYAVIADLKLRL